MWLFSTMVKYLLPITIALLVARSSPLGIKNGTILIAVILTICSVPQFIWLLFRLGTSMLMIRSRKVVMFIMEIGILITITIGLWIWIALI